MLVSHDRHLSNSVVNELWLVDGGLVFPYGDDLEAYVQLLRKQRVQEPEIGTGIPAAVESADARRQRRRREAEHRESLKPLKQDLRELEKLIASLSEEHVNLLRELADPGLYEANADRTQRDKILIRQHEVERSLENAESRWLELTEQLENSTPK